MRTATLLACLYRVL